MTDTIEDLESLYDVQMTARERASLEAQIWDLVPPEKRPKMGIGGYFHRRFGQSIYSVQNRHFIYIAGEAADPLWELIDSNNIALATIVDILRNARRVARKNEISLKDAISHGIETYKEFGVEVKTPGGRVFRRRQGHRNSRPAKEESNFENAVRAKNDSKNFWSAMRKMVENHISEKLEGYDPMEVDSVRRRVQADLNVFLTDMQDIIRRAPKGRIELGGVTRRQVIDACRALGMDPPAKDKLIDIKKAKLQRKLYARQYHPDVHGGSEETRHLFQAAIEGYKIIERYNEELSLSTNSGEADGS